MKIVVDEEGRLRLMVGRRSIRLERVDEGLYRAIISPRTLMKRRFSDLPLFSRDGEEVIIEYMPYSRIKEEYVYERKGLAFLDEASIWRDSEKGHVYAEILVPAWRYAYNAWMPLDLYAWIISRLARGLGFEVEVNREEQTLLVEIEKSYPLDTPLRIPLLELKELDSDIKKNMDKLIGKIKKSTMRILARHFKIDEEEVNEALAQPEEKISTKP